MQLGNGLARSEYSEFFSHSDSILDEDKVHPPKIPTNLPPLGDGVRNSDEAIDAVLNEDGARYPTVTQSETANQSSASTQPNKSRRLKPNCDSLGNLNFDKCVVMKGWTEEITYRSVAGLSIYGSHIKCDVFNTDRSLGMINMRHPYAIEACKNHLDTAGHKEGILFHEEQEW